MIRQACCSLAQHNHSGIISWCHLAATIICCTVLAQQAAVRSADERAAELKEFGTAAAARADAAAADAARAIQVIDKLSVSCCPNRSRQHDIWVSVPLGHDILLYS